MAESCGNCGSDKKDLFGNIKHVSGCHGGVSKFEKKNSKYKDRRKKENDRERQKARDACMRYAGQDWKQGARTPPNTKLAPVIRMGPDGQRYRGLELVVDENAFRDN
jgi:hypothetical protein